MNLYYCLLFFFLIADLTAKEKIVVKEAIKPKESIQPYLPPKPLFQPKEPYPWEVGRVEDLPLITKDFFRCKGRSTHSCRTVEEKGILVELKDCRGYEKHGLPIRNGEEFVYPILVDLLNYIQQETKKRVIITSGHRCPEHNKYVDNSRPNLYSKHQLGAEVSFYVQGLEWKPEQVVELIQNYYRSASPHKDERGYQTFSRYSGADTNVSTKPWFNREVFIKLFKKTEGRNFDNRHPYPYIAIQVRYDPVLDERVSYTWKKAHMEYLRR